MYFLLLTFSVFSMEESFVYFFFIIFKFGRKTVHLKWLIEQWFFYNFCSVHLIKQNYVTNKSASNIFLKYQNNL